MARHRSHSVEFKRQVAQEFLRCGNRRKSDALIARYTYPEVRLSYAQRYSPPDRRSLFDGQHIILRAVLSLPRTNIGVRH
jgi:hypothetical protein